LNFESGDERKRVENLKIMREKKILREIHKRMRRKNVVISSSFASCVKSLAQREHTNNDEE
jgi:phosphoserine phosphatase